MDVALLSYDEVDAESLTYYERAAQGRDVSLLTWEPHRVALWVDGPSVHVLYDDVPVAPDIVLTRTVARPHLGGVIQAALVEWRRKGAVFLNDPLGRAQARDKLATSLALGRAGVPFVPTFGTSGGIAGASWCGEGGIVVKPASSSMGKGLLFFGSALEADAWLTSHLVNDADDHLVVQPLMGVPGSDIRAFVVGGECIALMRRRAASGGLAANLSLGGTAESLPLTHPAAALAVRATLAVGLDYAGVDILEDDELVVLEVNAAPGVVGITKCTGVDVAGAVFDLAILRAQR